MVETFSIGYMEGFVIGRIEEILIPPMCFAGVANADLLGCMADTDLLGFSPLPPIARQELLTQIAQEMATDLLPEQPLQLTQIARDDGWMAADYRGTSLMRNAPLGRSCQRRAVGLCGGVELCGDVSNPSHVLRRTF